MSVTRLPVRPFTVLGVHITPRDPDTPNMMLAMHFFADAENDMTFLLVSSWA